MRLRSDGEIRWWDQWEDQRVRWKGELGEFGDLSYRCSDQRGRIPHCWEALGLDENGDLCGELVEVGLHIVLEDQATEGAGGVVLVSHLGEDVDQVVVEVWVLVQLLQSLLHFPLCCCVWTLWLLQHGLRHEPSMWISGIVAKEVSYLEKLQYLAQAILGGNPVHPDHRDLKQWLWQTVTLTK